MSYMDESGNVVDTDSLGDIGSIGDSDLLGYSSSNDEDLESNFRNIYEKQANLERAAELKRNELSRKTDKSLEYDSDGELETDSDIEIRAKEAVNAVSSGLDWFLESTENVLDVGQGDWMNRAKVDAVIDGKTYNMSNKDIISARNTTLDQLIQQYQDAEDNPNADKAIYTLRKFDGYNSDGSEKYLYKHGVAETSAADRYRNQWVEDGFEIVDEKRFIGAEKWEQTLHGLEAALDERALDYGGADGTSTDKASGVNFGAGYTELYKKNLLGIEDPTEREFAENKMFSEYLMQERDKTRVYGSNAVDAFQSGLITTGAGIGDAVLDFFSPGDNTLLNEWADSEYADKFVGYDRTETSQAMEEALASVKQGDVFSALGRVKDFGPELFAESLPFMATMWFGAGEAALASKAAAALSRIDKAKKLGKSADYIAKLKKRTEGVVGKSTMEKYKHFEDSPRILNEMRALSKNYGILAINGLQTNSALNERIATRLENGEEPDVSIAEALSIYAFQLPFTMLDKIAFSNVALGKGAMKMGAKQIETIKNSMSFLPKNKAIELGQKVIATGSKILSGAGEEAAQEYFQTWGEVLSAEVGVSGQSLFDVLGDSEAQHQAELGAIGGFGAGGVPAVIGATGGKAISAFQANREKKAIAVAEQQARDSEPLNTVTSWQDVPPGSTVEEVQSHMDTSIDAVVPFVQPQADGTYKKEDVINEVNELYTKIISPIRNHVAKAFADGEPAEKMSLGSSKVAINRMKNSIRKLANNTDLSEDESKMLAESWKELRDFEDAVESVLTTKLKKYTIEEINAMSHDQLVLEFGAEATTDEETEADDGAVFEDDDVEIDVEKLEEQAEDDLKKAAVANKAGNKKAAEKHLKKAVRKKKIKWTIDKVFDNDLFGEDKGIINRAAKFLLEKERKQDIETQKEGMTAFTKKWMIDNGFGEGKKTVDDVTDADLENFFAKGQTAYGRQEYYNYLNANGRKSIVDQNKILASIDKSGVKIAEDIEKKLSQKSAKHEAYTQTTTVIANEIQAAITDLQTNGIPEVSTNQAIPKVGETATRKIAIPSPTDEQIVEHLEKIYKYKNKKADGLKFEINYSDVMNYMFNSGKTDYEARGIMKLLDAVTEEINLLSEFKIDNIDGVVEISENQKQKLKDYEKKQRDKLNAEIFKVTGEDTVILTEKEREEAKVEIKRLEEKLSDLNKDINSIYEINERGDMTVFQEKLVDSLKKTDVVASELYKEYIRLKNALSKDYDEVNDIDEELKKVNKEMRELKTQRDNLVKEVEDAHKDVTLHDSLDNKTWIQRAKIIAKGLTNKVSGLLKGYGVKVKEIDNLSQKLYALNKQKIDLTVQKAQSQSAKVKTKVELDDKRADLDADPNSPTAKELDEREKKLAETKKKYAKLVRAKLARLKKEVEAPGLTLKILVEQAASMAGKDKHNAENKIPNIIASYTEANKKAGSLFSIMNPTQIGNKTLNKYVRKAVKFYKEEGIGEFIANKKGLGVVPSEYPIYAILTDKDGKVNQNVLAAVTLAAEEAVRNKAGMLYSKTDSEIARMLGVNEGSLTKKQKNAFRNLTRRANLANEIGNSMLQTLDLKMRKDGDIEAYERLKTSAGLLGIRYLMSNGILEEYTMTTSDYAKAMDVENKFTDSEKSLVTFVTLKKDKNGKIKPIDRKVLDGLREDFDEMEKESLIPRSQSSVQFKPVKPKTAAERKIKANEFMQPSEEVAEALNNSEAQEHQILSESANALFDEKNFTREEALRLMGWIPEDEINNNPNLIEDVKRAKEAANKEKERAYDELKLLNDDINDPTTKTKNALWFKYFTPKNNRLNIDSVLIDPQTEKELHRWLITPKASERIYRKDDINNSKLPKKKKGSKKDDTNDKGLRAIGFKFGVAQAFGYDIDKDTVEDTIAHADELMAMSNKELAQRIKDGDIDHLGHALQAFEAIKDYKKSKFQFSTTLTAEYDGITNGTILKILQISLGNNAAEILFKGGFVFDGVDNSGVSNEMAKKYQRGVDYDSYNGMLDEIGNSAKERKEIDKAIEEGKDTTGMPTGSVLDVYFTQALAAELQKEKVYSRLDEGMSKKGKSKLEDKYGFLEDDMIMNFIPKAEGNLSKDLREMFKFPTMMINYGSKLFTVQKNVSSDAVEEMYLKLLEGYNSDKDSEEHKIAVKMLEKIVKVHSGQNKGVVDSNVNTVEELVEMLQTEPLSKIGSWHKTKNGKKYFSNIEDNFTQMFEYATGSAVSSAINDTFGEAIATTEKINTNSRYMFRVFEQALAKDINDFIASEKKKKNGIAVVSREKLNEMIMDNKKFLPITKGPASDERIKDGIAIFTSKAAPSSDLQYGDNLPSVGYFDESTKSGFGTMSARTFVTQISEAFSAAGVLPTHTEDAVDMSKFVNKYMEEYGVTHVHDAIVIPGSDINTLLQYMNKGIVETSKGYSMITNFARAMRAVHISALESNKDLNLDEMRNKEEREKAEYEAKQQNLPYKPADYLEELIKMEDLAEKVWMKKERLYSHDVKVDQMPGADSMYTSKAEYDIDAHATELADRYTNRMLSMGTKPESVQREKLEKEMKAILKYGTKGIKNQTEKINKSLDIIESMTNALNGEC